MKLKFKQELHRKKMENNASKMVASNSNKEDNIVPKESNFLSTVWNKLKELKKPAVTFVQYAWVPIILIVGTTAIIKEPSAWVEPKTNNNSANSKVGGF